jgi:hypothetical protein
MKHAKVIHEIILIYFSIFTASALFLLKCSPSFPQNLTLRVNNENKIIQDISVFSSGLKNISAEARIELYSKGNARKAKAYILAEIPQSVSLQIFSPTDDLIMMFVTQSGKLAFYDRNSQKCHHGDACTQNIVRLIKLNLSSRDFFMMITGMPEIDMNNIEGVFTDKEEKYLKVIVKQDHGRKLLWFREKLLLRMESWNNDKLQFIAAFEDYRLLHEKFFFPYMIHFVSMTDSTELFIKYREVSLNSEIHDDAFRFKCPEGFEDTEIMCD